MWNLWKEWIYNIVVFACLYRLSGSEDKNITKYAKYRGKKIEKFRDGVILIANIFKPKNKWAFKEWIERKVECVTRIHVEIGIVELYVDKKSIFLPNETQHLLKIFPKFEEKHSHYKFSIFIIQYSILCILVPTYPIT